MKKKNKKKSPLTKAQSTLLKESLKHLLGKGLLTDTAERPSSIRAMVLKGALNAMLLD